MAAIRIRRSWGVLKPVTWVHSPKQRMPAKKARRDGKIAERQAVREYNARPGLRQVRLAGVAEIGRAVGEGGVKAPFGVRPSELVMAHPLDPLAVVPGNQETVFTARGDIHGSPGEANPREVPDLVLG